MLTKKKSLLLKIVLFEPEIAQNMGTIVRLCACFGISLGVIEPCGFPFSSKALKRAMMDYGELSDIEKYIERFQLFVLRDIEKYVQRYADMFFSDIDKYVELDADIFLQRY